uniref:Uncharacterized protein n=1 Tax=Rhizophora mucronata TaxID=61149 RepID=A0A2P2P0X1_RHIMU
MLLTVVQNIIWEHRWIFSINGKSNARDILVNALYPLLTFTLIVESAVIEYLRSSSLKEESRRF